MSAICAKTQELLQGAQSIGNCQWQHRLESLQRLCCCSSPRPWKPWTLGVLCVPFCHLQEARQLHFVPAGASFSAAFIVGYFDSIAEMHEVYDEHLGATGLTADVAGWQLTRGKP